MFEILTRVKFDTNILYMRSFLDRNFIIIYNPLLSQDKTFKHWCATKCHKLHKKKIYNLFCCPYNNYIAKYPHQVIRQGQVEKLSAPSSHFHTQLSIIAMYKE